MNEPGGQDQGVHAMPPPVEGPAAADGESATKSQLEGTRGQGAPPPRDALAPVLGQGAKPRLSDRALSDLARAGYDLTRQPGAEISYLIQHERDARGLLLKLIDSSSRQPVDPGHAHDSGRTTGWGEVGTGAIPPPT